MKPTKPKFNSHRKKIVKRAGDDILRQNIRHGETLIPEGDVDARIILQSAKKTHTCEILKTENLESNLKITCARSRFLRGLVLTVNDEGGLSIDPISEKTRQITLNPYLANGSWLELLSEGNDWFCWGWAGNIDLRKTESEIVVGLPFGAGDPSSSSPDADPDGDGLTNRQEAEKGTKPNVYDTDGDGLNDSIDPHPLNSNQPEDPEGFLNLDTDGDGYTDVVENQEGTDPLDPYSYPGSTQDELPTTDQYGPVISNIPLDTELAVQPGENWGEVKERIIASALSAWDTKDGIDYPVTFTAYDPYGIEITNDATVLEQGFQITFTTDPDLDGNITSTTVTYSVQDTIPPVIVLAGANPIEVTQGNVGADPGVDILASTDIDSWNSDWDALITDTSDVKTYTVTYNATDAAGNPAEPVTRTVEIVAEVVNTAPVITGVPETFTVERGTSIAAFEASIQELIDNDTINANDAEDGVDVRVTFTHDYTDALAHDATFTVTFTSGQDSNGLSAEPVVKSNYLVQDTVAPNITVDLFGLNIDGTTGHYLIEEDQAPLTAPPATADTGENVTSNWDQVTINNLTVGQTITITYTSDPDAGGYVGTATITVEIIADPAIIPETLIVDDDIFNSAEASAVVVPNSPGSITQTYAGSDKIYSFNGSTELVLYDGFKYDPYDFTALGSTISAYDDVANGVSYPERTIGDTTASRTYSIWFKANDLNGAKTLFWKGGDDGDNSARWYFILNQSSDIRLTNRFVSGQTTVNYAIPNGGTQLNTWYHVVVVWGIGATSKMYLNGQLVKDNVDLGTPPPQSAAAEPLALSDYHGEKVDGGNGTGSKTIDQPLRVGGYLPQGYNFSGDLAYPAIYHGELTPAQIQGLYDTQSAEIAAAPTTIPENLIVDDDLFNSSELSEVGSPTLSPSGLTYEFNGTQGLSFNNGFKYDPWAVSGSSPDGVIDNVAGYSDRTVGDLSPARTYSIWFNPNSVPASPSAMTLFWKGGPQYGDFTDDGWSITLLNVATASNLRQTIRVSNEGDITQSGGGSYFDSAQFEWDDTAWQHLVVVWGITTSTAKMYLNGIELTSTRTNGDLGTWHSSTGLGGDPTSDSEYHGDSTEGGNQQVLRIGLDSGLAYGFDGKIALPKIYHGELTQEQIEHLFTSGRTELDNDGQTALPPALP